MNLVPTTAQMDYERLEREVALAHEELDSLGVQRTSLGGPFGDIKYEERILNLAGRIKCLGGGRHENPA